MNVTFRTRKPFLPRVGHILAGIAFFATLAVSACATTQTLDAQHDDNTTTMEVASRLALDPDVAKADVDVDTIRGVVTLRGEVESFQAWIAAENVARRTEGVSTVYNRLEIVKDNEIIETDGDGMLTARVEKRLWVDPDVKGRNIDVDTQDAKVTLSGIVESPEARAEAVSLALNTEGVRAVSSELEVGDVAETDVGGMQAPWAQ